MREIKFRAWDKIKKEMVSKFILCPTTPTWGAFIDRMSDQTAKAIKESEINNGINHLFATDYGWLADSGDWYGIENLTVMQFTGLHDKNGKEIYESDLIKVIDHPTGIDSMAQVEVIFDDGAFVCGYNGIRLSDYGSQWIEVLGHIYEPHRNALEK